MPSFHTAKLYATILAISLLTPNVWACEKTAADGDWTNCPNQTTASTPTDRQRAITIQKSDKTASYDEQLSFSEGLAAARQGDKWGYIDEVGNIIIPIQYDDVLSLREGLMPVKKDGQWGYIDKAGKIVIAFEYDIATSFNDGVAHVVMDGETHWIDKTGREIDSFYQPDQYTLSVHPHNPRFF